MPASTPASQLPDRSDPDQSWAFIENGINKIFIHQESGMKVREYMDIYTPSRANSVAAYIMGGELYTRLIAYLQSYLNELVQKSQSFGPEALLKFYIREWRRYTVAAKCIHHLLKYLNRHWVRREMEEGKRDVVDVYTLHLVQWRLVMFRALHTKVVDAALDQIRRQRSGETIETSQIKRVVESFVALGMDETDPTKTTLDVYRRYFELPFLKTTAEYYQNEAKQFLANNNVIDYMAKAEVRLEEEADRVQSYLHPDVEMGLRKVCHEALISDYAELMRNEFLPLLNGDREDDLARMYRLLSRVPDGLAPLRGVFETHVRRAGNEAVTSIVEDGGSSEKLEPKTYVDALLDVHTQYSGLVKRAFDDEPEFTRSLDNACREFVNRNKLCKEGSSKSPELLAKYTDVLLRKGSTSSEENELDTILNRIMTVFRYIEDKDVFQKFYSRMLARRLVNGNSSSDDAETSMIGKLKEACGFEYTNKLSRMFDDIRLSKQLNTDYRNYLSSKDISPTMDSQYSILGTGFWPLTSSNAPFTPPEAIAEDCKRFVAFYKDKHDGRKLTWLWNLFKGEVKVNLSKNTKVPYTFQVSIYQMAILLLYNTQTEYTYEELAEATQLTPDVLDPALTILLKARVLLQSGGGGDKPKPGRTFALNMDFKSKKIRIRLDQGSAKEAKQEEVETNKTIEEDRKMLIQSAMVRIMKARKRMKHTQLVSETISQIRNRFNPKVSDIKKCIEILVDKEYIERLDDDEIGYLA